MAQEIRPHFSVSASSCFLPAFLKSLLAGEMHGLGVSRRIHQLTQGTFSGGGLDLRLLGRFREHEPVVFGVAVGHIESALQQGGLFGLLEGFSYRHLIGI
jgi:hypothetical protein